MPDTTRAAERQSPPALIDRRELLRPWKLASFVVGTALMVIGVEFYRISDWDVGISLIMPALTYLTAPWVVRVLLQRHWRAWPEALWWTWFSVDGVYWFYHTAVGNEMLRRENFQTSLPLYLFMGCIWFYRGSLGQLLAEIRGQARPAAATGAAANRRPGAWCFPRRLAALALVAGIYAVAVEPFWLATTTHRLGRNGPPASAVRLVQLSDLHHSRFGWREAQILERLAALRPDVIVLTGDAIDDVERLADFDRFLAGLPKVPTYAVVGNWEVWSGVDLVKWRETCRRHGVVVLDNTTARVSTAKGDFLLTGLDDALTGTPDWAKAVAGPPSRLPRLVLQHTPVWRDELTRQFANAPAAARPLAMLAGHTHGGQVSAFGWLPALPPGSGNYPAGWYRGDGGVPLYVSRGLGTTILPLRFGARPEMPLFLLSI